MRILMVIALFINILSAENREALIIGNSNYEHISKLKNMSSKLNSLKSTLEGLKFDVLVKKNLTAKELKRAIDNFRDRLAKNRSTIGFLYYSGHGCQLDNVGYLVPTNVDTQKKIDIEYDALNIDKMLKILDSAGNRVNMIFLDACRDIPSGVKGGTKGLGQAPLTPIGTLVVYATESKKTANDNAIFIDSLISHIKKPNINIRDIADDISNDVADQTREKQIPEVFSKRLPRPRIVLKKSFVIEDKEQEEEKIKVVKKIKRVTKRGGWNPKIYRGKRSYTKNSTNTVKDNYTGLIWQKSGSTNRMKWSDAKEYCNNLSLDGYSNWRLPTEEELYYLADRKKYNPAIDTDYFSIKSSWYWSATTYKNDSSSFWGVYFNDGNDNWFLHSDTHYVLCVR